MGHPSGKLPLLTRKVTGTLKKKKEKEKGRWLDEPSVKAPTHCPDSNQQPTAFIRPLCCLLFDPFGRKVALNTPLRRAVSSTAVCTFCACTRCNKRVVLVYKKDAGWEIYARNSLYFRSNRNLTMSDKNSCILNMQRGITKRTQINSSWTDITASLVPVLQNMKWRNRVHRKTKRKQYSAPPTDRADSLAHRQSETPIGDIVHAVPKASNTAEHIEHICSRPRPSLPKRFRRPTVGPVCSCLKSLSNTGFNFNQSDQQ